MRTIKLTQREAEVVRCAAEDLSMQETALCLCLSRETVKTHRHNALEKLGCHTIAGAVACFLNQIAEGEGAKK